MNKFAGLLTVLMSASPAVADTFIVGLGYDDVLDQTGTESGALSLEYHAKPFFDGTSADYAFGGAAHVDADGDVFLGLGIAATWRVGSSSWFVEGSFMPGYYDQGSGGTPLEGNLQFRTLLGVGYDLGANRSVSLAIDHKSNADIEDLNPGSETLSLRYRFNF